MLCNMDCFNCPHPDCIDDGISAKEIADSERRDRETDDNLKKRRERYRAWYRRTMADPARSAAYKAKQKAYMQANRDRLLVYWRRYYDEHREERKAYQRAYNKKHYDHEYKQANNQRDAEMQMTASEIVRSYKEAANRDEQVMILADLNACSEKKIKAILTKAGVYIEPPKKETKRYIPWTEKDYETMRRMYEQGASDREISEALGRSMNMICQRRLRMGLRRIVTNDRRTSCYGA
jgi:hypothetical protein